MPGYGWACAGRRRKATWPCAERLRNLHGAFALEPLRAEAVRGRRIVLVDDVMTSDASLFSAAQVLRAGGATHITALVLARTDPPA
jgi:predicted amidophosphoribosyltransferase